MKNRIRFYVKRFLLISALFCLPVYQAQAAGMSLIRDAEIEHTLRLYATPVLQAAKLTPENIRIFIIQSPDINAFVAGGSNIFLNTGLLLAMEKPEMLIGVMAHETGHIAGGHLARGTEAVKNATVETVVSYVLGAAAVASGAGDVGTAIMSAGQQFAERRFLAYTRSQEEIADQAAIRYLAASRISPTGLLQVFEVLRKQEALYFGGQTPYVLTHPLSKERIALIRRHIEDAPVEAEQRTPKGFIALHERMLAKLRGFLDAPEKTLAYYPPTDYTIPARYARSVAYYRQSNLDRALKEVESLIQEEPEDPFFYELKGQILFESGVIDDSVTAYRKAHSLLPGAPLIGLGLAKSQLATEDPQELTQALESLKRVEMQDKTIPEVFHQLAIAYGRKQDIGMAHLSLAEEALLRGQKPKAKKQASIALDKLAKDSPSRLRAEDIIRLTDPDRP